MRKFLGKITDVDIHCDVDFTIYIRNEDGVVCIVSGLTEFESRYSFDSWVETLFRKKSELWPLSEEVSYFIKLTSLLSDAKAAGLSDLKNKPVEVTLNGGCVVSWRIW